jgi:colanic acid/amylovoran biosynthesis glycosyltransferase
MMSKLAILSPSQNAYSETFIQAHRRLKNGEIVFYYGAANDFKIDGEGSISKKSSRYIVRILGLLFFKGNHFDITYFLKRSFKKHNITNILVEYGTFGADLLPYLKQIDLPFIVHFHGYDASSFKILEHYSEKYKELFKHAHKTIAVSRLMYAKLESLGCPPNKLIYNVYGPSEQFLDIVPNFKSSDFLFVGRLVEKKAPHYLVESFIKIANEFPSARLIIVGDGDFKEVLINKILNSNLQQRILLKGKLKPSEIKSLMKDAFCFIQHSVTASDGDMEGTPLTILESAAAGLPVISTFHAGIPDIIINNETGLLVNEHDIEGMANCMRFLLNNREQASLMGAKSKARILENFTLNRHLRCIDKLFDYE